MVFLPNGAITLTQVVSGNFNESVLFPMVIYGGLSPKQKCSCRDQPSRAPQLRLQTWGGAGKHHFSWQSPAAEPQGRSCLGSRPQRTLCRLYQPTGPRVRWDDRGGRGPKVTTATVTPQRALLQLHKKEWSFRHQRAHILYK